MVEKKFKILALNSSHRCEKGNTEILLDKFLKGAQSKGAETELLYTKKLKIHSCTACYRCIFNTPGKCFQKDEMAELIKKIKNADLLVSGIPVYFDSMPSSLKKIIERLMPLLGKVFEFRENRTYHLPLEQINSGVVNILTSGNPEKESFDSTKKNLKRIFNNMQWKIKAEFYFPASHLAVHSDAAENQLEWLYKAGAEIAANQRIAEKTIEKVNMSYISEPEKIIKEMNKIFRDMKVS